MNRTIDFGCDSSSLIVKLKNEKNRTNDGMTLSEMPTLEKLNAGQCAWPTCVSSTDVSSGKLTHWMCEKHAKNTRNMREIHATCRGRSRGKSTATANLKKICLLFHYPWYITPPFEILDGFFFEMRDNRQDLIPPCGTQDKTRKCWTVPHGPGQLASLPCSGRKIVRVQAIAFLFSLHLYKKSFMTSPFGAPYFCSQGQSLSFAQSAQIFTYIFPFAIPWYLRHNISYKLYHATLSNSFWVINCNQYGLLIKIKWAVYRFQHCLSSLKLSFHMILFHQKKIREFKAEFIDTTVSVQIFMCTMLSSVVTFCSTLLKPMHSEFE